MKKVLGMGAALVDILANVSDEWIAAQGVQKGGMNMVDWPQMEKFLGALDNPIRVPGGSTCNTMVGLSRLHGKAAFISKIGDDELGKLFQEHLKNNGVESKLGMSDVATGCVFSAVTPDAQRSMWTYLGASDFLGSDDFTPALYDDVGLLLNGQADGAVWFFALILLLKVFAMTFTNAGGGVGGTFGPTLFMGAIAGYVVAASLNLIRPDLVPVPNFVLVGMAGLMAGVMQAPLTAIFLIAEISGGYELLTPLILTAAFSYGTTRIFEK